jgi:DNA polymerase-3 subunit delta
MGLHPFIAKGYIAAAKKYSAAKIYEVISILREYDVKSKGFEGVSIPSEELQKEMIYKILH